MRAGADADGRDGELLGHLCGHRRRHQLEHHRERAGILDGVGVVEQLRSARAAALDDVAAEAVLALRGEADVPHHRDAGLHDAADLLLAAHTAFQLHRVRTGLLHEPDGGVQRFLRTVLVRTERQVGHHQRTLGRADHGPGERDELVDGDGQRGVVAEHGVAGGVADEQEVDSGTVEDLRGQEVVARQPGDLDALFLRTGEVADANPLERLTARRVVGECSFIGHEGTLTPNGGRQRTRIRRCADSDRPRRTARR